MEKINWTDDALLEHLRAGGDQRKRAWEYIFKNWRSRYLSKIRNLGGSERDADDALGLMCMAWEKCVINPDFNLKTASLAWYFDVCLENAYKRLRKQKPNFLDFEKYGFTEEQLSLAMKGFDAQTSSFLDSIIEKAIGEKCKLVLLMYVEKYSMKEIGSTLGLTEQSAKNKKSDCWKSLIQYLKDNPKTEFAIKKMMYD
jgi:DNA-directed RNA polymerase specialized sigma24 family protein